MALKPLDIISAKGKISNLDVALSFSVWTCMGRWSFT
jgi:hypothetical protein